MRKLIIPVINEIFGKTYTVAEEVQFFSNEHFLDEQDEPDKERITDFNFVIIGKIVKNIIWSVKAAHPMAKLPSSSLNMMIYTEFWIMRLYQIF